MDNGKIIIGRNDVADFPDLGLENIAVKIDTGAYTSSIHCHHIHETIRQNNKVLLCNFLDPEHPEYNEKEFCFAAYTQKKVRSSNGQTELRYIVTSTIKIFQQIYPIQLSLSERGSMKFSVLLGRKFLKGKFIVDPEKSKLSQSNIKVIYK